MPSVIAAKQAGLVLAERGDQRVASGIERTSLGCQIGGLLIGHTTT